jgi:hypothetical protein
MEKTLQTNGLTYRSFIFVSIDFQEPILPTKLHFPISNVKLSHFATQENNTITFKQPRLVAKKFCFTKKMFGTIDFICCI